MDAGIEKHAMEFGVEPPDLGNEAAQQGGYRRMFHHLDVVSFKEG
jgi:hypothetical protein